jgi:hypothetical protein
MALFCKNRETHRVFLAKMRIFDKKHASIRMVFDDYWYFLALFRPVKKTPILF